MENMIPVGPSGDIGKNTKMAVQMTMYGAGVRQVSRRTGLSRRRIKVIVKRIKSYGGLLREHQ